MVSIRLCLGDACFQTRAAGGQQVELGLYTLSLNFQLMTPLFAQVLRMGAANSGQILFNILRFHVLIELAQTRLQLVLLFLNMSELRMQRSRSRLGGVLRCNRGQGNGNQQYDKRQAREGRPMSCVELFHISVLELNPQITQITQIQIKELNRI